MNALRNMVTDLQITLADFARKIDRGEHSSSVVAYPEGSGQVFVGNGFSVTYDRRHVTSEDGRYPGAQRTFSAPPDIAQQDSVAGMQLIAHIPSC